MRTPNALPTDENPKIIILPWLRLDEPADFAGVKIFPRRDAIQRARSFRGFFLSEHVKRATSYFGSGARYPRSPEISQNALSDDDVRPELLEPSVIFLEDSTTASRVDDVLAALNFACIAANGGGRYTNAVVFERYIQTLVERPDFIVPMSRQMYGSKTTATRAINLITTRPHRCGDFQKPERDHWKAISRALDDPTGARAIAAVRKLVSATQDNETIPEDLERSLYAIALERLLSLTKAEKRLLKAEIVAKRLTRGDDANRAQHINGFDLQLQRAQKLLRPLLGAQSPTTGRFGYHIMRAWNAIRRERNGVWHPEGRAADLYEFEKQTAVRLNLIWFRVTQALIIASLVDAGLADADGRLALTVLSIEAWLGSINEADARDSNVASAMGAWLFTAFVCSRSMLANRDSGAWRAYFSDTGQFVIPERASAPA